MMVKCKNCGAGIPADDVNIDNMVAKCRACDAVFDISEQVHSDDDASQDSVGQQLRRPRVPLPDGITVDRSGEVDVPAPANTPYREASAPTDRWLRITRRWFSAKFIFLIFFCIAWDSFLIFWYFMAGRTGSVIMMVFPVAHVAVGIGLTYYTLAGLLNRTRIEASGDLLTIRHGPLPWKGNRDIPTRELDQLYVQRKSGSGRRGSSVETFNLCAVLRNGGRKLELVKDLEDADQALFMEQELEELLGIVDFRVGDEYRA